VQDSRHAIQTPALAFSRAVPLQRHPGQAATFAPRGQLAIRMVHAQGAHQIRQVLRVAAVSFLDFATVQDNVPLQVLSKTDRLVALVIAAKALALMGLV